MNDQGLFDEATVRFYASEMICALEYLHSNGIIHRDIKPENILLRADGHLCLTDFGLAKVEADAETRASTFCGTVQYMAPEIIKREGHGFAADWWSLGILIFDMLIGHPPFEAKNKKTLQDLIIKGKFKLPGYLSGNAASLIKSLLVVDPSKRLGSGPDGIKKLKAHKFFAGINWKKVETLECQPPIELELDGPDDTRYFGDKYTSSPIGDSVATISPNFDDSLFKDFSFVREETDHLDAGQLLLE